MPPDPMGETISYGPRRVPGPSDIGFQEDRAIVANFNRLRLIAGGPRDDRAAFLQPVSPLTETPETGLMFAIGGNPVALIVINDPPVRRDPLPWLLQSSACHCTFEGSLTARERRRGSRRRNDGGAACQE